MTEPTDMEKIGMYKQALENEAGLHWTRNNYFLVTSSILLVVAGLLRDEIFHLTLGILGVTLNSVWLILQHRSSKYIKFWKSKISELSTKIGAFDIYPKKLTRIEMRKLGYILPIPFILIWLVIVAIAIDPNYSLAQNTISNSTINNLMP